MKISKELVDNILSCSLSIENKFHISIGFRHPCGEFVNEYNDFVIYLMGYYDKNVKDFIFDANYIMEYNDYKLMLNGFVYNEFLIMEQKTDKITNFLIDFHVWVKNGAIIIEKYREFGRYKWKPAGDDRFIIKVRDICGDATFCCHLDEIEDQVIREHIKKELNQ